MLENNNTLQTFADGFIKQFNWMSTNLRDRIYFVDNEIATAWTDYTDEEIAHCHFVADEGFSSEAYPIDFYITSSTDSMLDHLIRKTQYKKSVKKFNGKWYKLCYFTCKLPISYGKQNEYRKSECGLIFHYMLCNSFSYSKLIELTIRCAFKKEWIHIEGE